MSDQETTFLFPGGVRVIFRSSDAPGSFVLDVWNDKEGSWGGLEIKVSEIPAIKAALCR